MSHYEPDYHIGYYTQHYGNQEETCPYCGEYWYGECPKDPHWVEYVCENAQCGYKMGKDLYSGEGIVIRDSKFEEPVRQFVNKVRGAYD